MIRAWLSGLLIRLLDRLIERHFHIPADIENDDAFDTHADEAIALTNEPEVWCNNARCAECLLADRVPTDLSRRLR